MKINVTKKEYKKLLDMLYISEWVMNAFTIGERTDTKEYKEVEQKFLSYAKDFGFDDLIEYEPDYKEYWPTRKFEDEAKAMKFIEEFEEEVFWDELIERLAKRDLLEKYGQEKMSTILSDEDLFNEYEEVKEKYSNQFQINGIASLRLR